MHPERDAPCGLAQLASRCQPNITCRAWPQEIPVARRAMASTARVSHLRAEAPIGAVESLAFGAVEEPVEPLPEDEPPQPAISAAARTAIASGVASLIGRRQSYPLSRASSCSLAGCKCPHTGQSGSGTTGSRLTSIVRRS